MVAIARAMARATRLPLIIQPNAGLPRSLDGQLVYDETPDAMAARVPELLDLGRRHRGRLLRHDPGPRPRDPPGGGSPPDRAQRGSI